MLSQLLLTIWQSLVSHIVVKSNALIGVISNRVEAVIATYCGAISPSVPYVLCVTAIDRNPMPFPSFSALSSQMSNQLQTNS